MIFQSTNSRELAARAASGVIFCALLILCFGAAAFANDPFPDDSDPVLPPGVTKTTSAIEGRVIAIEGRSIAIEGKSVTVDGGVTKVEGAALDLEGARRAIENEGVKIIENEKEISLEIGADVLFDFDKAAIKKEAEKVLAAVAALIVRYQGKTVSLAGHTDGKGTDNYNDKLSLRRANSVRDWLVKHGKVSSRFLSTSGYGKRRPIVPNTKPDGSDDPEGRQKNRRVEIKIIK